MANSWPSRSGLITATIGLGVGAGILGVIALGASSLFQFAGLNPAPTITPGFMPSSSATDLPTQTSDETITPNASVMPGVADQPDMVLSVTATSIPAETLPLTSAIPGVTPAMIPASGTLAELQTRSTEDAAQSVLVLVNQIRCDAGLVPLSLNESLSEAARLHSLDMASHGYFDHTGLDGREPADRVAAQGYPWTWVGENIAAGYDSPDEVVAGWMASPAHRDNILRDSFREMGIGLIVDETSDYRTFWTQLFATQAGAEGGNCP